MILRKIAIVKLFLFLTICCFGQTDTLVVVKKASSALKVALDGSVLYPGASLGVEFPVYNVDLIRHHDTPDSKAIVKERFVSMNAGWYHHNDFHDNLYFTAGWIMRRTLKGGFFTEFAPGLGYSRTFLGGTTYRVDDNGNVGIVKLAGYSYAVLSAGVGLGFNFTASKGIPLSVYYDFNIFTMFPYNSTFYFRPVMELGLIFRPANFIPLAIKNRKVIK